MSKRTRSKTSPPPKAKRKPIRRNIYSSKLTTEICVQIASGKSLRTVCRAKKMPSAATIFRWLQKHPDFAEQYRLAMEQRAFSAGAGTSVSIPAGCTAKIYTDGATNAVRLFLYGEGTWTPVLTCGTPGNLTITYNFQTGKWSRLGNRVTLDILMTTTSFTWSTASGNVSIAGLPFTPVSNAVGAGALDWGGITKAGYTQIGLEALTTPEFRLQASGSGIPGAVVTIGDLPSGGTVVLRGTISFMV